MNLAVSLILLIIGGILIYDGFKENDLRKTINTLNKRNVVKTSSVSKRAAKDSSYASGPTDAQASH